MSVSSAPAGKLGDWALMMHSCSTAAGDGNALAAVALQQAAVHYECSVSPAIGQPPQ